MKIKVNMVPLRGQNLDQVMPLLDYRLSVAMNCALSS